MIIHKKGIDMTGAQPQTVHAMHVLDSVYAKHGYDECWITSINDGTHSRGSRHYIGLAFDARSKTIATLTDKFDILADVRRALGYQYDVLLEHVGSDNEHYHVEFDPKSSATF